MSDNKVCSLVMDGQRQTGVLGAMGRCRRCKGAQGGGLHHAGVDVPRRGQLGQQQTPVVAKVV